MIHLDDLRQMPPAAANDMMVAIAAHLSAEDIGQVAASGPLTAEECIRTNVHFSTHGWVATDDADTPLLIGGVAPAQQGQGGHGYVWLLGTDALCANVAAVADVLRRAARDAVDQYDTLTTAVDIRCQTTLDLLARLGFTPGGDDIEHGPEARLFRPMVREV